MAVQHPKLAPNGCRCPCNDVHPATAVCTETAEHDIKYIQFGAAIYLPFCRPCADEYLDRMITAGFMQKET
jgi:hypothetical protein